MHMIPEITVSARPVCLVPSLGPVDVMSKPLSSPPLPSRTQLWKLHPLDSVEERRVSAFCRCIQLNSNYFKAKVFDMALRYGAARTQNVHQLLQGHSPIGLMGSSLQLLHFFRTLNLLLDECMDTSSGYYI